MRFTEPFVIERNVDWVEVADSPQPTVDGSILWQSQEIAFWEMRRQRFESNTNSVEVHFHTDVSYTQEGWRLEWGEYEQKS